MTYDTVLASLHPDDHDRVLAAVNDSLVKNTAYDLEYRIVRPNGEIRTVHGRANVFHDNAGHPIRMAGTCLDITDRKRVENAVLESETRFRTIADAAPVMIWIAGPDKLRTYFNRPWLAYTGRALEQELGNGWAEGVYPDDLPQYLRTYFEAFDRREPFHTEYRLKRADGTYGWILDQGVPLLEGNGMFTTYIGTCIEITTRKEMELALSDNENRFRMIFEQAAVGLAVIETTTGRFVHVNRQVCEFLGLNESEMLANTFMATTYPADLQADLDNMQRLIAGDIPTFSMEKRHVRRDDSVVWGKLTVLPLWMPGQAPDYHLAVMEDITARKRGESVLRTSQEKLRQALQASNTGLWDWNTETNEVSLSREWKRQLGYEEADLTDDFETWATRLHHDDQARAMAYVRAYTAQPVGDYQQEFRLRHKDGTYRWIEAHASFVTEPDGRQIHLLGSHTDITARKHMEEALRESEARYQSLIEAIPQQVWTARPDGTLDYVNRRVLDYFDCLPDDLLGWEWQSAVHPDDLPACQASWSSALRTGEPYEIEFRLRRACDGIYRWHLARAMPVKDVSGRTVKWFGTNTDITERKQAEEVLRVSEERYAHATAVGKVGVWEFNVAAGIYYSDANLKALFGYAGDELSTDPYAWLDLVHLEDRSIAMDHWQSIIAGESDSYDHELRMVKKDGTIIWTDVRGHAVRDSTGRLTHLFGATVDITDRKQAEQSLRESEERLRLVLNTLPAAAYTCDADGLITYFNERAAELWGRSPQLNSSVDRYCGSFKLHGPDNAPISHDQCWMAVTVQEGRAVNGSKIVIEQPDGRRRSVLAHANPLQDPSGRLVGGVNVLIDITERKRAEEALKLFRTLLDHVTDSIEVIDPETGRFIDCNEKALSNLGYTRDEFFFLTVSDIDPLVTRSVFHQRADLLRETGIPLVFESVHLRKDGTTFPVEISAQLIRQGNEYIVAIVRDITERKRAEAALHQREQDLRHALEERERISEDLHDGILQSLYAIGLGLEACKPLIAQQQQPPHRKKAASKLMLVFNQAIGQLNHVMAEVRNFIAGLESQVLQGGDFATALRIMVETMSASCHVIIEEAATRQISTEQAFHLMNVMREALSNSLRHSQAKRTTVSFKQLGRSVRLAVTDDGVGFNPATAHGVGHGLTNMAARAQKIGGRFAVRSKPGRGTKILLDLPKETTYAHN